MSYQIIIHGGAHNHLEEVEERNQICQNIVEAIGSHLEKGMRALDACEQAINMLEDAPTLDAGTGSYIQLDGKIRMDASIMTSDLDLGCVLQISDVQHPISVARKILENPMHSTLSGEGANQFAEEMGFPTFDVRTEARLKLHQEITVELNNDYTYQNVLTTLNPGQTLGTVGCVVRDQSGFIVAGTSTGGLKVCYPGRVGDAGQPGNGTYADPYAGISCTGIGEKIMRIGMSRIVALFVELGDSLEKACEKAIKKLGAIGGEGGLIAISHQGEISAKYNTKAMSYAIASD